MTLVSERYLQESNIKSSWERVMNKYLRRKAEIVWQAEEQIQKKALSDSFCAERKIVENENLEKKNGGIAKTKRGGSHELCCILYMGGT